MAAHQAIVNQPQILNIGPNAGGNIAVESQITETVRARHLGIVQIRVNILAGNVNDPETLFRQGLADAYALALQQENREPAPQQDQVKVIVEHDGIYANGGTWGTPNMIVGQALDEMTARWD